MNLSTSTFYYRPQEHRAVKDFRDAQLRDEIEEIQKDFPNAGYRSMRVYLFQKHGRWYNGKKLRRIMYRYGLQAQIRRKFISTTDSKHSYPVFPNLIKGLEVTGINQIWVSDITYIRIGTGFVYLAVILDVYSRRVIGWAISKKIDQNLTFDALQIALSNRNPQPGLIHHSDKGSEYANEKYVAELKRYGILVSMSRSGNPYDNAFAESFMKTLKRDEVYLWEYESFIDVAERVPHFIEQVYNKRRVHSGIGYLSPVQFETILSNHHMKNQLGQMTLKIS